MEKNNQTIDHWEGDYRLLDSGDYQKLEQIGRYRIIRPALSAPWPKMHPSMWNAVDATFIRKEDGKGDWKIKNDDLENKPVEVKVGPLKIALKLTSFGHLGIFNEQFRNWTRIQDQVKILKASSTEPVQILNLFAYTGISTLAAAMQGAVVTHVDASKGTVKWAQQNFEMNSTEKNVRWIIEDAATFVAREVRRGTKYQGIILDPPTYGRGEKKQVWKIEEHLVPLLAELKKAFDPKPGAFVSLSGHSEGFGPLTLQNLLQISFRNDMKIESEEMFINSKSGISLPSGYSAFATK